MRKLTLDLSELKVDAFATADAAAVEAVSTQTVCRYCPVLP